jgi:hypothetical protein
LETVFSREQQRVLLRLARHLSQNMEGIIGILQGALIAQKVLDRRALRRRTKAVKAAVAVDNALDRRRASIIRAPASAKRAGIQ